MNSQAKLSALDAPARSSDVMPPALAQFVKAMAADASLPDARLASRKPDRAVYLVPNGDSVCFPVHYQGGQSTLQCERLARIQAGGGRPTITGGPLSAVLMNVVPDEVRTVTARSASGKVVTAEVENNVYQVEVDPREGPVTLSYDTAGGPVTWLVEFPTVASRAPVKGGFSEGHLAHRSSLPPIDLTDDSRPPGRARSMERAKSLLPGQLATFVVAGDRRPARSGRTGVLLSFLAVIRGGVHTTGVAFCR